MMKSNAFLVFALLILGALLLFGCGGQQTAPAQPASPNASVQPLENQTTVSSGDVLEVRADIVGFAFKPDVIEVKKSMKVTWTNRDSVSHTVTSAGNFDSGIIKPGDSWSKVFDTPGTYDYICSIHPMMKGKVVVS